MGIKRIFTKIYFRHDERSVSVKKAVRFIIAIHVIVCMLIIYGKLNSNKLTKNLTRYESFINVTHISCRE